MHSYSRDFNHTAFVHVAIFAIAVLVYWLVISWLPTGIQLSPLTALTIFGLLEIVFEFWAWRFLRFLPFHVVDPTGDYDGTLAAGGSDQYRVRCTIKQTWSRIEIFFDSSGVTSRSFSAALVKDRLQTGQLELIYNYTVNTQRKHGAVLVTGHTGTAVLKLTKSGRKLEGDYFTEQERNSYGSISLERVSH